MGINSVNLSAVIEEYVYQFFVDSLDFNGVPIRTISTKFKIDYTESIDIIKELVTHDRISIQSSTNPHIIHSRHYPIHIQLEILDQAKSFTLSEKRMGNITYVEESTEYPICLYPSRTLLKQRRDVTALPCFTQQLALGEPQLKPFFFEIEVLERYLVDPRYYFRFDGYCGKISINTDANGNSLVRDEDKAFVETFGLGYDKDKNRITVAYLRYLNDLSAEHQAYWKSKEVTGDDCAMVDEYYRNTIEGEWVSTVPIFEAFLAELESINTLTNSIFGKRLFIRDFKIQECPVEFTYFFIPTSKRYYDFISLLDKMVSENINHDFFKGKVEPYELVDLEPGIKERKIKGTLKLLEEWLAIHIRFKEPDGLEKLLKPFKTVRKERQTPAHRITINTYDKSLFIKQKNVITEVWNSVSSLRKMLQSHPAGQSVEIPSWLDECKVGIY